MKRKWTFFGVAFVCFSLCCSFLSCNNEGDELDVPPQTEAAAVKQISPLVNATGVEVQPTFQWEAVVDAKELEGALYDLYLGPDAEALSVVKSDIKGMECTLDYNLQMGQTYYWKIGVNNGDAKSETRVLAFTVNSLSAPLIKMPSAEGSVYDGQEFSWKEIDGEADVDYTYTIMAGDLTISEFLVQEFEIGSVVNGDTFAVDFSKVNLEQGKKYYWYVTVTDGANSAQSEQGTFFVPKAGAPNVPVILSPAVNELMLGETSMTLEWSAAEDPDGEIVTYDVYRSEGASEVKMVADITTPNFTIADLSTLTDGNYNWRVVAYDGSGHSSSSEYSSFVVKSGDVAPLIVEPLTTPGVLDVVNDPFVWEDLGEGYTYTASLKRSSSSAWEEMADVKNITTTSFELKNKYIKANYNDAPLEYMVKIKAQNVTTGDVKESLPIYFKPKNKGSFEDVRGGNVTVYDWVRVGTQVWMVQCLKADCLTDGTPLKHLNGDVFTKTGASFYDDTLNTYYDSIPDNFYTLIGTSAYAWRYGDSFKDYVTVEKYQEGAGYNYSIYTAYNEKLAPEGWHTLTAADLRIFLDYIGATTLVTNLDYPTTGSNYNFVKKLVSKDYNGSDTYGLDFRPNGKRYASNWENGHLWGCSSLIWATDPTWLAAAAVDPTALNPHDGIGTYPYSRAGYYFSVGRDKDANGDWRLKWRTWGYEMLFNIRCLKE